MTELTEHHRRVLTEYLGECWHKYKLYPMGEFGPRYGYCTNPDCSSDFYGENRRIIDEGRLAQRRSFTTPTDLHAVYSRMVEVDKTRETWDEFIEHAIGVYFGKHTREGITIKHSKFMRWLSCYGCPEEIPARMKMAAEFIEGRK